MAARLLTKSGNWYRLNASYGNVAHPANIDYAAGNYGVYAAAALSSTWVQGVTCNMNWNNVETAQGTRNFTPLGNVLSAWHGAGKHVVIICRAASQTQASPGGNGFLPDWEVARIPTLFDADKFSTVPDWFDATFQSDWLAFIAALGTYLAGSPYLECVRYVRIGVGLGGEGFYLMGPGADHPNFATYRAQMVTWAGSPANFPDTWRDWQKTMLAAYRARIPATVPVIFPITSVQQSDLCSDGNYPAVDAAEWALDQGGYGIGQEGLTSTGYGTGAGYAGINTICAYRNANHPTAYLQFQPLVSMTSTDVPGMVTAAEGKNAMCVEWYESYATNATYQTNYDSFQTEVTAAFG